MGVLVRLGIVASVLWIVCVGGYELWWQHSESAEWAKLLELWCQDDVKKGIAKDCSAEYREVYWSMSLRHYLWVALSIGVLPVPVAWFLVWGTLATGRWILRGRG